jgi:hypothetical protein
VRRVCIDNGFPFFDATEILKVRFGSHPDNFYWPGDMHFNFEGLDESSKAVAAFMASHMIKPKN